jgi:hypothetical protein
MVVDQNPFMPTSKLISFEIARRLACEKMGKPINWAMYVEWTDNEQQHYKARLEQVNSLNSYKEVDDEMVHSIIFMHPISWPNGRLQQPSP